jgi:nicotinic acid mononucleotide adenylyltransferase
VSIFFRPMSDRLIANLRDVLCQPRISERVIVLLSTGHFNPVTRGDLQRVVAARTALEDRGLTVIGAYLSPTGDRALRDQSPSPPALYSAAERLAAIDAAIHDEGLAAWVETEPWESKQARPVDPGHVRKLIEDQLGTNLGYLLRGRKLEVMTVSGPDHAHWSNLWQHKWAICVAAPEDPIPAKRQCFLVPGGPHLSAYNDAAVWAALRNGDLPLLERLCGPSAAAVLAHASPQPVALPASPEAHATASPQRGTGVRPFAPYATRADLPPDWIVGERPPQRENFYQA